MTAPLVPVTVVGGYLGAGKTTLVNRMLADPGGRRLAVLVNDFGAINIDAALVAAHDGDTVELTNGCVCCSISDELGDGLDQVLALAPAPDHIVIETSGAADPAKVAIYGQGWPGCRLDSVVVVADTTAVRAQAADTFVGSLVLTQLAGADVVIASKADLVAGDLAGELAWLVDKAAGAPVVPATHGQVDPAVLFEPHGARILEGQRQNRELVTGQATHDRSVTPGTTPGSPVRFATWTLDAPAGASVAEVRKLVEELPDHVVRVKGIVAAGGGRYVVQRVGRRTTIDPADPCLEPGTLVVIAVSGDRTVVGEAVEVRNREPRGTRWTC